MPKRKENRTKGNTRPASSSRMADKLAMAGELGKFVGFDSLSGGSTVGTEQSDVGSHDQMFNSDAHFMTVLKQLGKRDTTTKLKALAEFSSYCDSQPVSELKCGLSIWPLMFNKLCTDNDHRVREATHKAMAAFLAKVRKDFQPHLKTVMGAWTAGMNDSHNSASAAAIAAFTDTFSSDRQQQVFQFTFKEIVQHMDDIVLVQTADTYTDPKSYTADERAKRYEMAVAMVILGVRHTLDQLSEEFISEKGDVIDQVVKKSAFLKLTKNPNPVIRAAFFKLMGTYLHKQSIDVSQPGKQLCQAVFSGLRETDSSAVVSGWEAMLVVMNKLENWSQHINLQKGVLPDLWTFLSSGNGYAVAKKVYPLLLPFLKALSKVHTSPESLYNTFLDKLIAGVTKDLSRGSYGGELEAIMESYMQCYTFVITMTLSDLGDTDDDNSFVQQLILKISDVIKMCFTVEKISLSTFHTVMHAMYKLVSQVLCNHSDITMVRTHLEHVRNTILTEVSVIIQHVDPTKNTYFTRVSDSLVLFCCYQDTDPVIHLCSQAADDNKKKLVFEFLHSTVIRTCTVCLNILNEHCSLLHAQLLSLTLQHYGTKQLLFTLGEEIKHGGESNNCLADLLDYILLILVRCWCEKEEFVENLVEVLLLVTCECPTHLDEILAKNVEANKVMEQLTALILLKRSEMKLDLKDLSTVNYSIDKIVSFIENYSCSNVPFMWQLLEAVLTKPDEQILSLQHSTTMLKSLCSRITVLKVDLPLCPDDLYYCKLICRADHILLNKVTDDIHQFLFILLCCLCNQNKVAAGLCGELTTCYQTTSSKIDLKSYFDWLLPKLVDHLVVRDPSLSRCFGVAKTLRGLHTDNNPGLVLSSLSYNHQVDVLPVVVADNMCHGKVLIEPQTYPIGSFENKPTNNIFPSDLYGTLVIAVLCSSDKDEAEADTQEEPEKNVVLKNKLRSQDVTDALISLGLASLFLDTSAIDFEMQIYKMIRSTTQQLLRRASAEGSLCEVLDAVVKCVNDYALMESMNFVFHLLDTLTTEESTVILNTLTTNMSCTQLCTRFNGVCFAELLREKVIANHLNRNDDVIEGLAVCLLRAQSSNPDWQFITETIKALMDQQQLVEYDSLDDASHRNVSFLSLGVFTTLVTAGRVSDECWDFILCSAVTVMQLFDDKVEITTPISILHCSLLRLCLQLDVHFVDSAQQNLNTEWKEFFSPAITEAVILQFKHILKYRKSIDGHFVKVEEFLCCKLLNRLCKEPVSHFSVSELVEYMCSGSYPVQITSYHLLTRMLKITIFGKTDESQNLDEWVVMLKSTVMMSQKKLSDDHLVSSGSDGVTVAYMLVWLLCIAFLRDTDHGSETRMQLLDWIKETGAAEALVCELITHIPVQSFCNHDHIEVTFTADITNLSMITFKAVAQQLPVVLRQWFITLDRKAASLVEEFTKKYITPLLWKDQLATFEASPRSFDNMEVRLGRDTPEVMIKYRIDDTAGIELVMLLSEAHPLYLPTITQERGIKVNIGNWKKWILQLNSYIGNQNGTLLQGLAIWKANLDKHFAGMEDCMICFSVIHHSNQSLPRLTCKTCKKKFHNICLYKWFSTSAKSTCPLCRNIF